MKKHARPQIQYLEPQEGHPFTVDERTHEQERTGVLFHAHETYEVTVVLGGEGCYEVRSAANAVRRIPVCRDTILLWDARIPHRALDEKGKPLHQIIMEFRFDMLKGYSLARAFNNVFVKTNPIVLRHTPINHRIKTALRTILEEDRNALPGSREAIQSGIYTIFTEVYRFLFCTTHHEQGGSDERIRNVLITLHERFHEHISLETYATSVGLSVRHFSDLFRKTTGKTFIAYCNALRIEYAKEELSQTERSVTSIAFAAGFDSLQHFNKTFKQHTTLSPRAYRKREKSAL